VAHVELPVDVVDRPVGREKRRLQGGAIALVEAHLAPDVLLEELLGRQEIVLVVLLEDAKPPGIGERLQVDGGRIDLRRDIGELDRTRPRG
jgi:hypothetical protein